MCSFLFFFLFWLTGFSPLCRFSILSCIPFLFPLPSCLSSLSLTLHSQRTSLFSLPSNSLQVHGTLLKDKKQKIMDAMDIDAKDPNTTGHESVQQQQQQQNTTPKADAPSAKPLFLPPATASSSPPSSSPPSSRSKDNKDRPHVKPDDTHRECFICLVAQSE